MSCSPSDRRRRSCGVAAVAAGAIAFAAHANPVEVFYESPSLDRWMYPFNPSPGTRGESSVFGSTGDPRFDDRDAQMIVGFDTSADIPPALGTDSYDVVSARLTIEVSQDLLFVYDDTQDSYRAFLDPEDPDYEPDTDPGQPLELFGLGFRFGFDTLTFEETTPYTFGDPIGQGIRTAFAADVDEFGAPFDVSLSVQERFDPQPWAVGTITGLAPGSQVPIASQVVFDIDVSHPGAARYLRTALDLGMIDLCVTSFWLVEEMGTEFPAFYTKENPLVTIGLAMPARLELKVELLCPADIDGGGSVDFGDVLAVLASWGPCEGDCPADVDGNGEVGFSDILRILQAWGDCP